ncbi:hypothetical protein ABFY09_00780 [Marinomonas sp. 5E14-1]|uniref:hypothetical protein n=1 Tax=Marinomonas sp. 5E14-1 TaxID=3153922 RepID=UPI0032641E90
MQRASKQLALLTKRADDIDSITAVIIGVSEQTNPQKYSTAYDVFSDQTFPAIQEAVLDKYEEVMFAGAVDVNGYFPTHNKKLSQPLSGDFEKDLVNNRTKRIFNDPTGSRCGAHTDTFYCKFISAIPVVRFFMIYRFLFLSTVNTGVAFVWVSNLRCRVKLGLYGKLRDQLS